VVDDEDDESAGSALRDVRYRDEDEEEVVTRPAAPAKWSGWFLAPLGLTFLFTALGAIMAFELTNSMWAYQHGTQPAGTIVRGVAGMLDMDPKD
jgi:glucose dehydrogenase